jgi:hypothetical protein
MPQLKLVHKIVLSFFILLVLIFASGFVYTYLNDRGSVGAAAKSTVTAQFQPIKPPPKPGPNALVGVAVEGFDSPVAPGGNSSIIISTAGGAACTISVTYNGVKSTDPGLVPKTADAYGTVSWSWHIPQNTPPGNWPVDITCRLGKHWAVYDAQLTVTN